MHSVQQSAKLNVSSSPDNDLYIGIPMITSSAVGFASNRFAFREIFLKSAKSDSSILSINNMLARLKTNNLIQAGIETDLLAIGVRKGQDYFSFSAELKANSSIDFNKDLLMLMAKGNMAFIGKAPTTASMRINTTAYTEYAFGMVHTTEDEKWSYGGKLKLLSGIANFNTQQANFTIQTNANTYSTQVSSHLQLNASGIDTQKVALPSLLLSSNLGMAVDFGVNYKATEDLSLSANVVDLGGIGWKSNVVNYTSNPNIKGLTFGGWDVNKLLNNNGSNTRYVDSLADTLKKAFYPIKSNNNYSTALNTKLMIGANYQIIDGLWANALFYGRWLNGRMYPGFALGMQKEIGNWLHLSGNYNLQYGVSSFGMGASIDVHPVQIFMASDNVFAISKIDYTRATNVHVGINLLFWNEGHEPHKRNRSEDN